MHNLQNQPQKNQFRKISRKNWNICKTTHCDVAVVKSWPKLNQILPGWSLGGPLWKLCSTTPPLFKMVAITKIRNFVNCLFLLWMNSNVNCSYMAMNSLTYFLYTFPWSYLYSIISAVLYFKYLVILNISAVLYFKYPVILNISAVLYFKYPVLLWMNSNVNCSYMAMNSLTYFLYTFPWSYLYSIWKRIKITYVWLA
jgi:hypothetical protein